ncbi:MAG: dephospho-CoA kinase [Anaeroplasma sp.]
MKRVIGITGGIASGKSNVCHVISDMGYPVINCDDISYELSQKEGPLFNVIINRFGEEFLDDDGNLDRKKLGKLIFNNSSAKIVLNQITHPIIKDELISRIKNCPDGLVFIEVPLLYEAKLEDLCDKVICVFLPKKNQVERLMQREGIDEDYALVKIHSQMDLYMKKALADFVIDSRGSFNETKEQVLKIIEQIKGV